MEEQVAGCPERARESPVEEGQILVGVFAAAGEGNILEGEGQILVKGGQIPVGEG